MALVKVRYKGLSDIREMSKKDLAAAGVGVDGDLYWEPRVGKREVFIEDPSDRLMEIFKDEGTFTVTDVSDGDDKPEDEAIIKGEALDDTGNTVRDLTTGQESVRPEDQGENPAVPATPTTKGGKAKKVP